VHVVSEPVLTVALIEVLVGILLLVFAADEFVEGSANLASAAQVSPVLVGAVIVGFGTSAPELLISVIAAVNGDTGLGLGNIVGSNVANLSLVLAAAAMIVPVLVTRPVLVREAPLSLLAVLLLAYVTTGGLARWEGVLLLAALVGALGWIKSGGVGHGAHSRPLTSDRSVPGHIIRTVAGLVGTVAGAQLLVWGAMAIADIVGLTGGFVGFTLVAVGTSLPELVTVVIAARKGETELILGNLLGSNVFNSLAVGGAIALINPGPIVDEGLRTVGVVVMVAVAIAAWVAMVTRRRVHRLEGVVLLVSWVVAVMLLARMASETAFGALMG
jgi:cation:H+ antiporter